MKPEFWINVLAVCTFMIFACKKENQNFNKLDGLSSLTKEVIGLSSLQKMKEAQSLLSTSERQKLWEVKLSIILENDCKLPLHLVGSCRFNFD